ncbi:hypothetical protein LCGC14_1342200 [marine sediment metagenome]|uniref:Uncharacterized protein n=1 Tax=marine sediment metagenome TaxID=412755 RepID=A0A0F9KZQ7_9ZZZZ
MICKILWCEALYYEEHKFEQALPTLILRYDEFCLLTTYGKEGDNRFDVSDEGGGLKYHCYDVKDGGKKMKRREFRILSR